jgi:hypothetical protein
MHRWRPPAQIAPAQPTVSTPPPLPADVDAALFDFDSKPTAATQSHGADAAQRSHAAAMDLARQRREDDRAQVQAVRRQREEDSLMYGAAQPPLPAPAGVHYTAAPVAAAPLAAATTAQPSVPDMSSVPPAADVDPAAEEAEYARLKAEAEQWRMERRRWRATRPMSAAFLAHALEVFNRANEARAVAGRY